MNTGDAAATGLDACDDCALSSGEGCCGGSDHGHGSMRSDRAVAAAAGAATMLLAVAVLTVDAARAAWVVGPAVLTALGGAVLLVLGLVALGRSDMAGETATRRALHLLPIVSGGLVVSLGLALVALIT